ncbi:DUF4037 domain-containing protein [Cellulomonas alba]|uniref:DUF4037 domain-containing protein n=1 Tax=Cellulomonas alba TaxID=3053467 RepID=A0ABT7SE07_9CELL|nr:DUF4037 domain-containing protein [Cellulomonas alba]MDM7854400.1 DUF4037 domain-containing protein [Cellulomonas alba]
MNDRPGTGIDVAREYFHAVVGRVVDRACPGVGYAAARVGPGSDVLGLDDTVSRDHDWGLRLQVFTDAGAVDDVRRALERDLPETFLGLPTRIQYSGSDRASLGIDVATVGSFARRRLGFDPRAGMTDAQWLSVTGQAALEVVAGEVFADGPGDLTQLRDVLTWYPDDIWRYVVACGWHRIHQELPLMGRAGDRGDELGSRVIAARLTDAAVHLAFTLSRRWAPYSKWRGTAFRALPVASRIDDHLRRALGATSWVERGDGLRSALEELARLQADAGLPSCEEPIVPFWDRPYLSVEPTLVPAIHASITDPAAQGLPRGLGSIEQRTDNVDILVDAHRRIAVVTV